MSEKGRDILKKAFIEADAADFSEVSTDGFEWEPSAEFEKKMERLSRRRHGTLRKFAKSAGKRAAIFAVCLTAVIVLTLSAHATLDTSEDSFIHLEVYNRGKFTEAALVKSDNIDFDELPRDLLHIYYPDFMPEGFYLASEGERYNNRICKYKNADGEEIIFLQETISSRYDFYTEGGVVETVDINGCIGYRFTNKLGQSAVFWVTGSYYFCIKSDAVSADELFEIAISLRQIESEVY